MGAVTVNSRIYCYTGASQEVNGALTLSSSYATNGDTYTPADFGLAYVESLMLNATDGYTFQPDLANLKIKAMGPMSEAGNGTVLDGISVRYTARGY